MCSSTFWPRQRAFLVDVPYENDADASALGIAKQARCTLPDLREAARRRIHALGLYRLYGIYDHQVRGYRLYMAEYLVQRGLAQHQEFRLQLAKPVRTHPYLACALLPAHVEYLTPFQSQDGLQEERALANARLPAQKEQAARHQASSKHAVQLLVAHVHAWLFGCAYLLYAYGQRLALSPCRSRPQGNPCCRRRGNVGTDGHLLHRIPTVARRAHAHPLWAFLATVVADVYSLSLCHYRGKK